MSERSERRSGDRAGTPSSEESLRHELRTALNAVLGLSRMLNERDLPVEEMALATHLGEAAERLRRSAAELFGLDPSHAQELSPASPGKAGGGQDPHRTMPGGELPGEPSAGSATAGDRDGRRERILLVDDEELNRLVGERDLRRLGYGVDAVADGLEALEALERERYDLVLMDCKMPGPDGAETTRRIRERQGEERLPVVAFTASVESWPPARLAEAGMDDCLPKPYSPDQLRATLQRWLGPEIRSGDLPAPRLLQLPGTGSAIDLPTLLGLRGEDVGSSDPLPAIVRTSSRDVRERMELVERALDDENAAELEAGAHSLKGISGMIGALRLSELCRDIECRAQSRDLEPCRGLVSEARQQTDSVLQQLQQLLTAKTSRLDQDS